MREGGGAVSEEPGATAGCNDSKPPASVIDTIHDALRAYLGSMDATSAAVQVWLVLYRAGMLNKEFVVDVE